MVKTKHKVAFSAEGKTAELVMCAFCKKLVDINKPELCMYYKDDYEDNSCVGFEKVDDVAKSLTEALKAFTT